MKCELFLGRLQPFHNGHKKIIEGMKNPIVVLVKGKVSGTDTEKNPLDEEYQKKLLKMVFPDLDVSVSPNGFLPGILGYLRKQGKEVVKVYAGADRIASYQDAVDKANAKMPEDQRYHVTFKETERVTSATAVRDAIKNNNKEEFKKLVPEAIWGEWDTLRKKMGVVEGVMPFRQWIKEEEATATDCIKDAQKDLPLGRIMRRKKKKE